MVIMRVASMVKRLELIVSYHYHLLVFMCTYLWVLTDIYLLRVNTGPPHLALVKFDKGFTGAKFRGNTSRLFRKSFCSMNAWHSDHTPTGWLPATFHPHANRRNNTEWQSVKANPCNNFKAWGLHGTKAVVSFQYKHRATSLVHTPRFCRL